MPHLLILGMGYTAGLLAARLRGEGWRVTGVRRAAGPETLAFDDDEAVRAAIAGASHILSSVPPEGEGDPVLERYGAAIAAAPALWTGYLSSTGVYGDTGGAWVDEASPVGIGRRTARAQADLQWGALRADMRRFRLPGIYGPGRSALDRVREGRAHRIALPGQVFSRVHVDDIVSGMIASFDGPAGIYNLADDLPCGQNRVIETACDLLGLPWPRLQTMDEAQLSPMARGFYAENRRVANGRAKRLLGWSPRYPTYAQGLRACL
ncbi:NAD(P)-dependent oxidoreductase [Sphingobium sp. CCH11-B1]|uniref:NAD(P)-dependent oxidoreductase n=1 Tax=Sphingobium sp. CCH11-B1 TaxID=1768781 RepID=UPI0008358978|nr:NAD(P)-dependent oxidoreductase [Sphingobium sp. CCH11-B1]MEA3388644.1 SDR family NAD(P)-dependent oxidoreductase [Pseudomonadota bacterium]